MSDPPDEALPRRVLAGAAGSERRAPRPDPEVPRWFEPLHVRDPGAARERAAAQVAAGADVLIAPTWLTHRRALLPVGETRRVHEWTAAAVRVAREGVDVGLERREGSAPGPGLDVTQAHEDVAHAHERPATSSREGRPDPSETADRPPAVPVPRHPILVAAVLPALDADQEPGTGRLLPRNAASERDHRAQAGVLADAGADLIVVEGQADLAAARMAIAAAVETGLSTWAVAPITADPRATLPSGESLERWAETAVHAGATVLLVSPASAASVPDSVIRLTGAGTHPVGVLPSLRAEVDLEHLSAAARRWLDAGARHLGAADGATPPVIATLRAAVDEAEATDIARRMARRAAWMRRVTDAARRAPGGRALWIGKRSPDDPPLPPGFAWEILPAPPAGDPPAMVTGALPAGVARLVVSSVPVDPRLLSQLVDDGGILLVPLPEDVDATGLGLRILELDADGPHTLLVARREP